MMRALMSACVFASVLSGSACAEKMNARLEGVYSVYGKKESHSADARLQLGKDGKFSYTMPCFSGDLFSSRSAHGTYVVKDRWITLTEIPKQVRSKGCSDIKRVFVIFEQGEPLLLWDLSLAWAVESGNAPSAWRRGGDPQPYTKKLEEWLPEPYSRYLSKNDLTGKVTAAGELVVVPIFGPGNQSRSYTPVEIDLGWEHGVFEGQRICGLDKKRGYRIEEVSARTSKIEWGDSVAVGMPVSVDCPR